jgi:PKD repeat protein
MVWQPSNRAINLVIIILLFCGLVSTVSADSTNPPESITICGYVTYANEIGIWWFNPYDPDFGGVEIWLDDVYLGNTTSSDHFYNAYSAVVGTHTFSTHSFDSSGNVNSTWVNLTFMTKEYPGCTENWTCDTCSRPVVPVADFFANQTTGTVPLAVNFTDNSTNMPTSWNWNFGDGNYSSLQNPVYTYNRPGLYSVTLNASNIAGYNSTTKVDYIDVIAQSPVASFTANVTTGLAPLGIQFNDTSTNFPAMWNWSFGDTSWFNTTDPVLSNATKSYPTGGNYTVTLYVSNSGGSDSVSQYVDVWNRTSNDFIANQTSGNVTFPVLFTDTSYNATSWFWIFDGFNTSTSQSPTFEYTVPGIYSVNHSSSNAQDTFWTNKSDFITAYPSFIPGAIANFTQNTIQGLTPLEVQFTDTSTGSPTFWNWSFGDGTYSDIQDVTKTYSTGGYYEINLTVWNANATRSSKLGYVDVWNRTSNDFIANQTFGNVTFAVLFTDTSYNATNWFWIFDGFNTSTEKSPTFEYAVPGIYSVNHSSRNAHDIFWTNISNYIIAYPMVATIPTANFTGTPASGVAPLTVQFNDLSTGSPTNWNWSFGEGNFSNLQSPPHIYASPGLFSVTLNVSNSAGNNTFTRTNYINVTSTAISPTANFTGTPTSGVAPLTVQFNDLSTGSPTNWNWSFDDGNFSTLQDPPHIYAYPGLFNVSLNVTNSAGSNTLTRNNYINVTSTAISPTANFTGTPTSGVVPMSVQFTDLSTGGPTNWNWSFGDGNFSNLQSPSHIYAFPGLFSVSLNVSNSAGNNSFNRTNYITVLATPTITPTQPTITPTQPTITPTQPSGGGVGGDGGDTCRFNPSTGGASETGGKAGEKISIPFIGNLGASECVPVVVVDISVVPAVDISGIMVSAEKANIGPVTQIPGNPRAYYLDLNWYWVRDAEIKDVYITFSVDEGWMKDQGITPENLVMMRYYDNSWHEIPTQITEHSNGRYYYVASASGVSYFAVTYKGALRPLTIQTLASQITIPQQTLSESLTIEPTRFANLTTVPKTPVKTTTTVPPISSEESGEIPQLWIFIGVGAFIGFVLIALLIRRWWIRRQNPALFRKYD